MAKPTLPTDVVAALAAGDVEPLLALHRATFGDARMDGTDGDGSGDGNDGGDGDGSGSGGSSDGDKGGAGDTGFPPNTPLERMTGEQREAYWRFHARKHEERVKALDGLTPDQLRDLRDKATRHDALERELMSDKDKAVAEAADKAKADALAGVTPKLVRAEFKAALTGRVPADQLDERLTATVDALDLAKFLTATGDVDTAKVSAFVDGIAPATGNGNDSTTRRGPSPTGHGKRGDSSTSGGSVASGRDLYREKHGRKSA